MWRLSHTAEEIDRKLKRIPHAVASESAWTRDDDWQAIADQKYDSTSGFAQSGKAVAEAIAEALGSFGGSDGELEAIKENEIIELFSEDEE